MKTELQIQQALEVLHRQGEALLEAMAAGRPVPLVTAYAAVLGLDGFAEWVLETDSLGARQFAEMVETSRLGLQAIARRN